MLAALILSGVSRMHSSKLALMVTIILAGMSAAAVAQPNAAPPPSYQPIPAVPAETIPPPPQGVYIWRPGHWKWNGYAYHWVRGAYIVRQPRMHEWVNGAWVLRGGVWVWVGPHWR